MQDVKKAEVAVRLKALPKGTNVGIVTLLGSLCPVTLGHIQGFIEARRILLAEDGVERPAGLEDYGEVLGYISLNTDFHMSKKLASEALSIDQRQHLVSLATDQYPWILQETREGFSITRLRRDWPSLKFIHYRMNGADDVLKYQKWERNGPSNRLIIMGRKGSTEAVLAGLEKCSIDVDSGYCIMGPELEDISSSAVRDALSRGDVDGLTSLLHEDVADWCGKHYVVKRRKCTA